jgi:hypothetical protein
MTDQKTSGRGAFTRREFVTTMGTMGATGAAFLIVPRRVLGRGFQAPSDTVNIAVCGIGGMGAVNAENAMGHNIVAICDVDFGLLDRKLAEWARRAQSAPSPQNRPTPPPTAFKDLPRSKAQLDADARWPKQDAHASLQKFVREQMSRSTRTTGRCSRSRRTSTR